MIRMPALLALMLSATPVVAASQQDPAVTFKPARGARIPLDLVVKTGTASRTFGQVLDARPALLMPVDYLCRTTCGPALAIASSALTRLRLRPGKDYRLILVGLDPAEKPADAARFIEARVGEEQLASTIVGLVADEARLRQLFKAIGYRYKRGASDGGFIHPIGAITLTPQGEVSRLLSPLALDPDDLKLALVEAGQGTIGSINDRIALLCSAFDPVRGLYTSSILTALRLCAFCMVAVMLLWLSRLLQKSRASGELP